MGMAASQARYLGLTARKTNVEYEGQQINQARTALGNQSATLWNQMLTLSIPTVPKTTDFTTVQYSFSDGYNDYTISTVQSVDKEVDGVKYNSQVTYYYNQDTFKGVQAKNTNPQAQAITETKYNKVDNADSIYAETDATGNVVYKMKDANGTYQDITLTEATSAQYESFLKANNLTADDLEENEKIYSMIDPSTGETVFQRGKDLPASGSLGSTQTISTDTNLSYYMIGNSKAELYDPNDAEQAAAFAQIQQDFGDVDFDAKDTWVYTKNGKMCFARGVDIQESINSVNDPTHKDDRFQISSDIDYQKSLNQYYASTISQRIEEKDYAILDDASGSGRFSSIKLSNMSETFEVKSEEVTDEKSYNDAMNQYNYDVTQYEKAMSDINAKTSVIQEQDRTLELRLKQLETEQKALTTEMDAVKGVLQKNVESTFGTFK